MSKIAVRVPQAQMWRLVADRRTVRMNLPPIRLSGVKDPVSLHLDLDASTIDEILTRLTELRTQMLPPPGPQLAEVAPVAARSLRIRRRARERLAGMGCSCSRS